MSVTVNIANLSTAIHDVRRLGRAGRKAQIQALVGAGDVLEVAVRQHLSLTDHTLRALAQSGHPYARRHGSIKIHNQRPWMVHRQSGSMAGAVTNTLKVTGPPTVTIGIDYARNRYFKYVIQGTRVMLPRDTLYQTSQLQEVRKGMMKAVIRVLGDGLRTQATVRF